MYRFIVFYFIVVYLYLCSTVDLWGTTFRSTVYPTCSVMTIKLNLTWTWQTRSCNFSEHRKAALIIICAPVHQRLFASWYPFFFVCWACAECLPHKWHVCEWLQCSVHAGALPEKSAKKRQKNYLWPVNRCIPNTYSFGFCTQYLKNLLEKVVSVHPWIKIMMVII